MHALMPAQACTHARMHVRRSKGLRNNYCFCKYFGLGLEGSGDPKTIRRGFGGFRAFPAAPGTLHEPNRKTDEPKRIDRAIECMHMNTQSHAQPHDCITNG